MPLADWTFNHSTDMSAAINTTAPLVGAGKLEFTRVGASSWRASQGYRNNAGERGRTRGKLRQLVEIGNSGWVGFYCMASSLNTLTSGSAYFGHIAADGVYHLKLQTNGFATGTFTTLDTAPTDGADDGDVQALELEWIADPVEFGGVKLILRAGTINDLTFNSLVEKINVTASGAQELTSTVAEGPAVVSFSAVTVKPSIDSLDMFDLVAA